jgi:hypothetical protein
LKRNKRIGTETFVEILRLIPIGYSSKNQNWYPSPKSSLVACGVVVIEALIVRPDATTVLDVV